MVPTPLLSLPPTSSVYVLYMLGIRNCSTPALYLVVCCQKADKVFIPACLKIVCRFRTHYMQLMVSTQYICTQNDTSPFGGLCSYGIDWSGPVAEDDDTVVVPELPDLLSTVQLQHLNTILEDMANNNSSDEECSWIEQYLESRSYIERCVFTE